MSARSWIAMMLLINYLLIAGIGCVNRPQDQIERVRILTSGEGRQYQQCRYMRLDALETFMLESMASRCQSARDTPPHHVISVISTVSVHTLTQPTEFYLLSVSDEQLTPCFSYQPRHSTGIRPVFVLPPQRV